jgi:hypothetical protein
MDTVCGDRWVVAIRRIRHHQPVSVLLCRHYLGRAFDAPSERNLVIDHFGEVRT